MVIELSSQNIKIFAFLVEKLELNANSRIISELENSKNGFEDVTRQAMQSVDNATVNIQNLLKALQDDG